MLSRHWLSLQCFVFKLKDEVSILFRCLISTNHKFMTQARTVLKITVMGKMKFRNLWFFKLILWLVALHVLWIQFCKEQFMSVIEANLQIFSFQEFSNKIVFRKRGRNLIFWQVALQIFHLTRAFHIGWIRPQYSCHYGNIFAGSSGSICRVSISLFSATGYSRSCSSSKHTGIQLKTILKTKGK